ncbi:MAG: hypothetical protein K0R54_5826 [Clostridiaceae bacterium]|nr:hypothetical protein [Clostridiaceae bacterium]
MLSFSEIIIMNKKYRSIVQKIMYYTSLFFCIYLKIKFNLNNIFF